MRDKDPQRLVRVIQNYGGNYFTNRENKYFENL